MNSRDRALAATLGRQRQAFLAFLTSRMGSRDEAEEVLQAAFVKGLKVSKTVKEEGKITAWFYRLLRNALTDHWRKKAAEGRAINAYGTESERLNKMAEASLNKKVCACVNDLVDTIKPEYADAIRKVDLDQRSVRDFAESSGVTPNSAAVRLHRARATLKKRLLATCGKCAEHGCRDCDCGKV